MNLTNLEKARDYEVRQWLEKELNLTQDQKSLMYNRETIRFAPFEFYKDRNKGKSSFLWRLTILFLPIYFALLVVGLPFKFMASGKWGYSQKFVDKYFHSWLRKLNL